MRHTFWHAGQQIGEADLEPNPRNPAQRAGIFFPTAYGHTLLPRMTGVLTKQLRLKRYLDAIGRDPDSLTAEETIALLADTDVGRAFIDHGRMMSEITVQGPRGAVVSIVSIAFTDIDELRNLGRELDTSESEGLEAGLDDLPPDAPKYICSFTSRMSPWARSREPHAVH